MTINISLSIWANNKLKLNVAAIYCRFLTQFPTHSQRHFWNERRIGEDINKNTVPQRHNIIKSLADAHVLRYDICSSPFVRSLAICAFPSNPVVVVGSSSYGRQSPLDTPPEIDGRRAT